MKIDVMVASVGHLKYVKVINDTIDEAAKARGTGIARRTDEYIADKINQGKAIIALNRESLSGAKKLLSICPEKSSPMQNYSV